MRSAMYFKTEIGNTLEDFKAGKLDRDSAHEQLRKYELLDIEIAAALNEVEKERGSQ